MSQLRGNRTLPCEATTEHADAQPLPTPTELPTADANFADLILVGLIVGAMMLGFLMP